MKTTMQPITYQVNFFKSKTISHLLGKLWKSFLTNALKKKESIISETDWIEQREKEEKFKERKRKAIQEYNEGLWIHIIDNQAN